jgi:hypothetical protein
MIQDLISASERTGIDASAAELIALAPDIVVLATGSAWDDEGVQPGGARASRHPWARDARHRRDHRSRVVDGIDGISVTLRNLWGGDRRVVTPTLGQWCCAIYADEKCGRAL